MHMCKRLKLKQIIVYGGHVYLSVVTTIRMLQFFVFIIILLILLISKYFSYFLFLLLLLYYYLGPTFIEPTSPLFTKKFASIFLKLFL